MSHVYYTVILSLNYAFVIFYNIEMVLKLLGLGCQYFTNDAWNIFDFTCVIASDIGFVMELNHHRGPGYSIVLFFRCFRMVRLIKYINLYGSAETTNTLYKAAPQIKNILTLIGIITFIYASLGVTLFGANMYRFGYNDQSNFRNIFNAILLLLRSMTGEDWNVLMHDLASKDPHLGVE